MDGAAKLVLVVVHPRDARGLREALIEADHRFTELPAVGGFLRESSTTLLLGVAAEHVEEVLALVRERCTTRERWTGVAPAPTGTGTVAAGEAMLVSSGGATVFVLNLERLESV
ncbi:MAG: cyclic-di-AMP receptor [Fimbriimonadaceae bacterium]|nr:cyclic-di-AMP receptor [Fimbriimonadaceae bacterium]